MHPGTIHNAGRNYLQAHVSDQGYPLFVIIFVNNTLALFHKNPGGLLPCSMMHVAVPYLLSDI
jgi:hypothetical protein